MQMADKIAQLRRQNNLTQEQLAGLLGVTRQAVSRWESGAAYPETEKLIRLSRLYGCTVDYLLKDELESPTALQPPQAHMAPVRLPYFEKKSEKMLLGMPLWHVNIGYGRTARGFFAVGLSARGVVSVGLASLGVISVGVASVGLLAIGVLAAGLLALGSIAVGLLALGAIAVGVFAAGAMGIGAFSCGAHAVGKYAALGDTAMAAVAIGKTEAAGTALELLHKPGTQETAGIIRALDTLTPWWLGWAKRLFLLFL